MWSESSVEANEKVRSAIVNCVCPDCGGALELRSNQFTCLGRCGKPWRAILENANREAEQTRQADSHRRSRKSRK
jgi:hypothetical protein